MSPQPNPRIQFTRSSRVAIAVALVGGALSGLAAPVVPAPPPIASLQLRLNSSVYQPSTPRDPFVTPGPSSLPASATTTEPTVFHLDGFLGSTTNLTAIVNGRALTLNTPVVLETASGRLLIKAVTITFEEVVLEVGGKRLVLKRATENPPLLPPR